MAKQKRFIKKIIFGIIGAIVLFILIVIVNIIILIKNEPIVSKLEIAQYFPAFRKIQRN